MDVVVVAVIEGLHPTKEDVAERSLTAATATAGVDRKPRPAVRTPAVPPTVRRWPVTSTLGW